MFGSFKVFLVFCSFVLATSTTKKKNLLASFAISYLLPLFDKVLRSVTHRFSGTEIEATFDSFAKFTGQKVKNDTSAFAPFTKAIPKKVKTPKEKTPKAGTKRVAVRTSPRYPKKKAKKK